MWDLSSPGIEPSPPALVGEVLTTGPPGRSITDFSCCWCPRVLRRTGVRDFVELPSMGVYLVFFSWWHRGAGCGEEDTGEGPSHPSSWGACHQHDSSLVLTCIPGLRSYWSGVSTVESRLPSSHTVPFGRESPCPTHAYREEVTLHLPGDREFTYIIWNSSVQEKFVSSPHVYLFSHLLTSAWTRGCFILYFESPANTSWYVLLVRPVQHGPWRALSVVCFVYWTISGSSENPVASAREECCLYSKYNIDETLLFSGPQLLLSKKKVYGTSWVHLPMQGASVLSLVGELRSHMGQ